MRLICYILIGLSISSCQYLGKSISDDIVARVHDVYLYQSDIERVYPGNLSKDDSLGWVSSYINHWAREQLVLNKAKLNLSEEQLDVDRRLQEYKNSLIRFSYEQKLVNQELDTAVSVEEIKEYYSSHLHEFTLKDHIVRATIIIAEEDAPRLDEVRRSYRLNNAGDRYELEEYCQQFASNCVLNDSTWIDFKALAKMCPIPTNNPERFLANLRYREFADTAYRYFVHLHEYQVQGTTAPISYVRDKVKDIVIHERKIDLLKRLEESLYSEARKKNYFETY